MKNKIFICILAISLIISTFSFSTSVATTFDYEYMEIYTYSRFDEGESNIIIPYTYFEGTEFGSGIPEVIVTQIIVGGIEGRGIVALRNQPGDSISSMIQCPTNPGDPSLGEKVIDENLGAWEALSLKADDGELFFKQISGIVYLENGTNKSFIIRFPGSEPEPNPPDPVQNVKADTKAGDIIVTWDLVPNADGYKVYINGIPVDVGNTNKYIFPASPGQYSIQVSAYNRDGESEKSAPVNVIVPKDNPIIIVNPPSYEFPELPIPIYFPDPPAPPAAPPVKPYPSPGTYMPKPDDYNLKPSNPDYDPRHYDPDRDGPIYDYVPPPLEVPETIESPGPLPSNPDPILMPHDDPLTSDIPKLKEESKLAENPVESEVPIIPELPIDKDPVEVEIPRTLDPVLMQPPRDNTGYVPEPPRTMDPPR